MQKIDYITFDIGDKTYQFGHVQVDGLTPNETVHIKTQENYSDKAGGGYGPGFDFPFGGSTDANGSVDFMIPVVHQDSTVDVRIFHDLIEFTAELTTK